jgi:hypothetical protein
MVFKRTVDNPEICEIDGMFCPKKLNNTSLADLHDSFEIGTSSNIQIKYIVDQLLGLKTGPLQMMVVFGWIVDFSFPALVVRWVVLTMVIKFIILLW